MFDISLNASTFKFSNQLKFQPVHITIYFNKKTCNNKNHIIKE